MFVFAGKWIILADDFWTYGLAFDEMPEIDPDLYSQLQSSSLIVFKGDLNYRKLVQDTNWAPDTPLSKALGRFRPGPLVTIRTLKADTVAGIQTDVFEATSTQSPDWMISGRYGIIQFDSERH